MKQTFVLRKLALLIFTLTVVVGVPDESWAKRPLTVTFLHYYSSPYSMEAMNELVDVVNAAHPQFRIESNKFEMESFKIAIKAMLSTKNPPDLFTYWAGARVQALVDDGLLSPIDDIWEAAGLDDRFPPAVRNACTYNGHRYAIPLTRYYAAFSYNARIFHDHNISIPKTWDEFLAVCQTLKSAGETPIALGSRNRWPAQFWFDYLLLRTAGPAYRRALMAGTATYDDPEVKRVYHLWKGLMDRGFFNDRPNLYSYTDAAKMVFTGRAAMTLMGNWIISMFENQLGWRQETDFGFFPFPAIDPRTPDASVGPIDCVVLPKASGNKAARTVLPYFTDVRPQKKIIHLAGSLSPNLHTPPSFYSPLQNKMLEIINQTPHWAFNYDLATPPPIAEIGLSAFSEFLDSPANYPAILEKMATRIESIASSH